MALSLHFFHHPKLSSISSSTPPKNSLSLSSITPSSTKMPTFSLLRNHHLLRNRPPIKPPFSPSFSNTQFKFRVNASSSKPVSSSSSKSSSTKSIVFWAIVTAILAVSNRVFYKLALVPLQNYPFFLAQFITFGYVAIYFAILFIRHRAGIVTDEMLAIPKSRFVLIGLLEALGLAGGMASAAMIPGPVIPILHQEKSLDIFVVNSFGSGCQALFVLVLLPLLSNLKGIPFDQLPQYLKSGAGCFLNIGANNTGKFS
uniref:Uncharacterized protein n=1 Tax=Chenopodium quinoa TaxID=63459 RepID=A0A803LV67_CHEQI